MNRTEANENYRGSVYIPPSYRGNALSLCRIAEEEECDRDQAHEDKCTEKREGEHCTTKDNKCDSTLISRLFSGEHGWLWVILLVAAVLLLDKDKGGAECKSKDDTWIYVLLLLLFM